MRGPSKSNRGITELAAGASSGFGLELSGAKLRRKEVPHRFKGGVVAVQTVLHQSDAARGGGNGRGIDAKFALHTCYDLFAPVADNVGQADDAPLDFSDLRALVLHDSRSH